MLYLHDEANMFSKNFLANLQNENISEVLKRNFVLLGWDISNESHHKVLLEALSKFNKLLIVKDLVITKTCAALFILPVDGSIVLFSVLRGKFTVKDIFSTITSAEKFFCENNEIEDTISKQKNSENTFGCVHNYFI